MRLKGAYGTVFQGRALLGHRLRGDVSRPVNKSRNTASDHGTILGVASSLQHAYFQTLILTGFARPAISKAKNDII